MDNKIRIIFIGTPDFAVPCLKTLINDSQFEVMAVITQPDKKVGRKQILTSSPIKIEALKHNLKVWQPEKILDFRLKILDLNPDIIIAIAYAQLIPKEILTIPRYGCINVHASLLPKYRGASCIQTALLNGDQETGVTIMKMDEKLDTGPILYQEKINISVYDTAGELYYKLAILGAKILISAVKSYINGELKPVEQDTNKASYAPILKKDDGKINWQNDAAYLERFMRAMQPWPGAWTKIKDKTPATLVKINKVAPEVLKVNQYKIGELFLLNNALAVQCGRDALTIKKIQLAGKKEITAEEFIKGHKKLIGKILG